jgi:Zn-dependent protease
MNTSNRSFLSRLGQDRIFWIVVVVIGVAFLLLQRSSALPLVATLLSLLIAITVHECAHAWSADKLGDPTARLQGRVTLNPLAHLDPLGTVMMVITTLTGVGIGWGKPVPVAPWRLKYGSRRGNALVALAGPASNLLAAALISLLLRAVLALTPISRTVALLFQAAMMTNVVIAFFNLLPLPPLDGSSVLVGLLSLSRSNWAFQAMQFMDRLSGYGFMLLIGLVLLSQFLGLNLFGWAIVAPARWVYGLLLSGL